MSNTTLTKPEANAKAEKKPFLSMSIGKPAPGAGKPVVLGGSPRANLLPPEVLQQLKQRSIQRALRLGVVGVFALVIAASAGAWFLAMTAQASLIAAQEVTTTLSAEQAEFSDVRDVQQNITASQAAAQVGGSTEIDWKAYLLQLQTTLPAGVTITTVDSDIASPIADYLQSEVPLEGARVGTLTFTATSPTLPSIPDWLDGLATLPGFVDATPGSVELQDGGTYSVNITMHINALAYSGRFAAEGGN